MTLFQKAIFQMMSGDEKVSNQSTKDVGVVLLDPNLLIVLIEDISGKTGPRPCPLQRKTDHRRKSPHRSREKGCEGQPTSSPCSCWLLLNYHRVAHFLRRKSSGGLNLCDFRAVFFK